MSPALWKGFIYGAVMIWSVANLWILLRCSKQMKRSIEADNLPEHAKASKLAKKTLLSVAACACVFAATCSQDDFSEVGDVVEIHPIIN